MNGPPPSAFDQMMEKASRNARVQPQSYEAEQSVLGACLIDTQGYENCQEYVNANSFYWPKHQLIWMVIETLALRDEPVDLITVTEELRKRDQYEGVGGDIYLDELQAAMPFPMNVEHYARVVEEKFRLRRIFEIGNTVAQSTFQPNAVPDELLNDAIKQFDNLETDHLQAETAEETNQKMANSMRSMSDDAGSWKGFATTYPKCDEGYEGRPRFGLVRPGECVVLAGYPKMGKSLAVGDMVRRNVERRGIRAVFTTTEMGTDELKTRFVSAHAHEHYGRVMPFQEMLQNPEYAKKNQEEWWGYVRSLDRMTQERLHFFAGRRTIRELRSIFRKIRRRYPDDELVFVVDYIQDVVALNPRDDIYHRVQKNMRMCKHIAQELHAVVLVVSQFNQEGRRKRGPDAEPQPNEALGGGAIHEICDRFWTLHRPPLRRDKESGEPLEDDVPIRYLIQKIGRNVAPSRQDLAWLSEVGRIIDYNDKPLHKDEDAPF